MKPLEYREWAKLMKKFGLSPTEYLYERYLEGEGFYTDKIKEAVESFDKNTKQLIGLYQGFFRAFMNNSG